MGLAATLLFAGLVALAIYLFQPDEPRVVTLPTQTSAASQPALAPYQQAKQDQQIEEAARLGKELLRAQVALEDSGAALWAGGALAAIEARIERADEAFRNQAIDQALEMYKAALAELQALQAGTEDVLAAQTAAGDAALEAGDAQAALVAFSIAAAITPNDAELRAKLRRAEGLDEVVELSASALSAEKGGRLGDARTLYREASALDTDWLPAAEGLTRVAEAIRQQRFTRAMSRGFAALAGRDYAGARKAFQRASEILPDSPDPGEGLLQVEQAENTDRIADYQQAALAAVAADDWQAAINAYEAALAIEGSLVFAAEGLAYAKERLAVAETLQRFIGDPTLLQGDAALAEAQRALVTASRYPDLSAQTRALVDALARLVSTARVRLPLTITSDNETEVSILRVGPLGRLERHELALIPGRYVLVGKRRGYRDVRQELELLAHAPAPTVNVVCTERI